MNQKGSSSVFLVMILAGMITVTMAFISVSKRVASIACSDDLMHLAGRSVLSEYDPGLKQAYGLFAFRGQQNDIAKGMATYLNTALEHRDDMELSELRADASEYALMNTDRFEKEILKYTRFAIARNLIRSRDTLSGGSEGKLVCKEKSDRILRRPDRKSVV